MAAAVQKMANAFQPMQGPPDAPQADAPQMMQQGLQSQPGPAGAQPQLQAMPKPSPQQVTAGLRHFHAIIDALEPVAKDSDLGKSDMKKKIIDSATTLVADRIMSPAQAVAQLRDVPERPFDQKQWVMGHIMGAVHGANNLLDHFRASSPGDGNWQADIAQGARDESGSHIDHMTALHAHYKGLVRG